MARKVWLSRLGLDMPPYNIMRFTPDEKQIVEDAWAERVPVNRCGAEILAIHQKYGVMIDSITLRKAPQM